MFLLSFVLAVVQGEAEQFGSQGTKARWESHSARPLARTGAVLVARDRDRDRDRAGATMDCVLKAIDMATLPG